MIIRKTFKWNCKRRKAWHAHTKSAPEERRLYDAYSCQRGNERDNFTEIPRNTRVTVYEKHCLLGTLYGDYGVEAIVNFVNYLTSVTIDYYICMNVTNAAAIINMIDGVTINVPVDILNPYYNPSIDPEDEDYEKN